MTMMHFRSLDRKSLLLRSKNFVKDTFLEFFIHRMPFGGLFKEDFLTNTAFSKKISEVQIDRKAFGDCVGMMCILLERLR